IWQLMENAVKQTAKEYNITEIRTPIFEDISLFLRSVGESSDIVNKEMYVFKDKGDRTMALRPEGTAGVVRACIENGLFNSPLPLKLWYLGNNYRYENPQAGRYREFTQFGVEYFGNDSPLIDAELILLFRDILTKLGVTNYQIQLNSIGCRECRQDYNKQIREFAQNNLDKLCNDCRHRASTNPLRMLDCKNEDCQKLLQNAPKLMDTMCPDCKEHFATLTSILDDFKVPYTVNTNLVRGLDYYSRTVFEFVAEIDGKPLTFGGGGRYDYLVEEMGGKSMPGCGFAIGLDRLKYLVQSNNKQTDLVYIANAGSVNVYECFKLANVLRSAGIHTEVNLNNRSFKAQMKYVDKVNARYLVVIGDDELTNGVFTVKNLNTGQDCVVPAQNLIEYLSLSDQELKKVTKYADF
ncbi:MAG: histidine--tRNA ligase, partial [Clostridia bacterium]|nr:histidine--tRNA ligase [Clostridia bacterium]